jgi:hypothetical protein
MTLCIDESAAPSDDGYWDYNAAQPVLLIDEATEAITEAFYRLRAGSVLDDRHLTAAGVALSDLFGGLKQSADLLITSVGQYATTDPLQVSTHSMGSQRVFTELARAI